MLASVWSFCRNDDDTAIPKYKFSLLGINSQLFQVVSNPNRRAWIKDRMEWNEKSWSCAEVHYRKSNLTELFHVVAQQRTLKKCTKMKNILGLQSAQNSQHILIEHADLWRLTLQSSTFFFVGIVRGNQWKELPLDNKWTGKSERLNIWKKNWNQFFR